VGIGTSSPASKLSVIQARQGNDVDIGAELLMTTATTTNDRLNLNFSMNGVGNRARAAIGAVALDATGGYNCGLAFYTRNAVDSSGLLTTDERMRITSAGRVGIGTASPSSLLDVNTSAAGNFVARITNNSGSSATDHALLVETSTASAAKIISARNAGVERFVVTGAGDVIVNNTLQFNSGYGSAATAYGCRAWVNFNGTGTVAIRASGNVSSVSDNNTGNYTVNFSTAMPDTNYAYMGFTRKDNDSTSGFVHLGSLANDTKTTSAVQVRTTWGFDVTEINVAIIR
jgi:hypothetical protein